MIERIDIVTRGRDAEQAASGLAVEILIDYGPPVALLLAVVAHFIYLRTLKRLGRRVTDRTAAPAPSRLVDGQVTLAGVLEADDAETPIVAQRRKIDWKTPYTWSGIAPYWTDDAPCANAE